MILISNHFHCPIARKSIGPLPSCWNILRGGEGGRERNSASPLSANPANCLFPAISHSFCLPPPPPPHAHAISSSGVRTSTSISTSSFLSFVASSCRLCCSMLIIRSNSHSPPLRILDSYEGQFPFPHEFHPFFLALLGRRKISTCLA